MTQHRGTQFATFSVASYSWLPVSYCDTITSKITSLSLYFPTRTAWVKKIINRDMRVGKREERVKELCELIRLNVYSLTYCCHSARL